MTRATRPEERSETEPPEVPGFRTWRGVYLFVFGWFVLVVVLLTIFTGIFSSFAAQRRNTDMRRGFREMGKALKLRAEQPRSSD